MTAVKEPKSHFDPAKKYYFITACLQQQGNVFGRAERGKMEYSPAGKAAMGEWLKIPTEFPEIILDQWILMPDHLHAIIAVNSDYTIIPKARHKQSEVIPVIEISVSSIINRYKESVRKWFLKNGMDTISWKAGFYSNSIRDEKMLLHAREYIIHNPMRNLAQG